MSIERKGDFKVNESVKKFRRVKKTLPLILANNAKNHFVKGFRQGGGQTDKGKWIPRKKKEEGGRRAILVFRGRLWKSIGIISASFDKISVGSRGVKYAKRHNEGLDGMPQREFVGPSKVLEKESRKKIENEMKKMFKF